MFSQFISLVLLRSASCFIGPATFCQSLHEPLDLQTVHFLCPATFSHKKAHKKDWLNVADVLPVLSWAQPRSASLLAVPSTFSNSSHGLFDVQPVPVRAHVQPLCRAWLRPSAGQPADRGGRRRVGSTAGTVEMWRVG